MPTVSTEVTKCVKSVTIFETSRSFFDIDESAVHSPNALTDYNFNVHRSKFTFLQLIKMLLRHLLIIMYTFILVRHLRVA